MTLTLGQSHYDAHDMFLESREEALGLFDNPDLIGLQFHVAGEWPDLNTALGRALAWTQFNPTTHRVERIVILRDFLVRAWTDEAREVIRHEMGHAATLWADNGPNGHSAVWKQNAMTLGSTGEEIFYTREYMPWHNETNRPPMPTLGYLFETI